MYTRNMCIEKCTPLFTYGIPAHFIHIGPRKKNNDEKNYFDITAASVLYIKVYGRRRVTRRKITVP